MSSLMRTSKEEGSTLVIVALALASLLIVFAFLLDVGSGFLIQHRLQVMADNGADAGMSELANFIAQKASERWTIIHENDKHPPPRPNRENPLSILTQEDRDALLSEGFGRVDAAVRRYVSLNQASNTQNIGLLVVEYPLTGSVSCSGGSSMVRLRVSIELNHAYVFDRLLTPSSKLIRVQSYQTMNLCPGS